MNHDVNEQNAAGRAHASSSKSHDPWHVERDVSNAFERPLGGRVDQDVKRPPTQPVARKDDKARDDQGGDGVGHRVSQGDEAEPDEDGCRTDAVSYTHLTLPTTPYV